MKKYFVFLLFLIFIMTANAQKNIDTLLNCFFKFPEMSDSNNLYLEFITYGIDAIPYLIKVIDSKEKYTDFCDAYSSKLFYSYLGIQAAYIIEMILANYNNKTFLYKTIYKRNFENSPLTYNDMLKIKVLYEEWWNKINKSNYKVYKMNKALKKSPYFWSNKRC